MYRLLRLVGKWRERDRGSNYRGLERTAKIHRAGHTNLLRESGNLTYYSKYNLGRQNFVSGGKKKKKGQNDEWRGEEGGGNKIVHIRKKRNPRLQGKGPLVSKLASYGSSVGCFVCWKMSIGVHITIQT